MKRYLLGLLLLSLLIPGLLRSQSNPQTGHGAPTGVCLGPYTDTDTGNFYVCKNGQYTLAGGSGSSSPSSTLPSYTISISGSTISATPTTISAGTTYTGTDLATVWNSLTTALATVGGKVVIKNGVYPVNSLTNDSTTGCSNFDGSAKQLSYALSFPANTVATSVQWIIEGEAMPLWPGESLASTVNNNGVIINITPTAVSSVTAGNILAGFWQRPVTNCTLTASNASNEVHFKNMAVRFPVNTRGNEIAFAPYFSEAVEYENVTSDFNVSYNTLATGSAPANGTYASIGIATPVSGTSNYMYFRNTFSSGYGLAYDFQTEHVIGETVTAIYSNNACEFGRSGTAVFHPNWINNFIDQENGAGCIWGPQMQQGSLTDINFDFELAGTGDTNWYSTARAQQTKLSETNTGYGTGLIRYQVVITPGGIVSEVPALSLFSSGGQNFQALEATNPPNLALTPIVDNFTRPNATTAGPAWFKTAFGHTLEIVSNAAVGLGAGLAYGVYSAQPFNSAQFSRITLGTIDASATTAAEVQTNALTAAQTYYIYFCSNAAATGSGIQRVLAGTPTTLASQTSTTGCAGSDVLELRSIPVGANVVLYAYRNGLLDKNFSPNPVTDTSPLSGGAPGFALLENVQGSVTVTKAEIGNLPVFHASDSTFNNETYTSKIVTTGNCNVNSVSPAACGAAASGVVVVPTTTTTYTVNTTQVTTNSRIFLLPITDATGVSGAPTCIAPPTGFIGIPSARVVNTSFTFTLPSTTGTSCWNFWIVN